VYNKRNKEHKGSKYISMIVFGVFLVYLWICHLAQLITYSFFKNRL